MTSLEEEKKKNQEEANILEQAATYMSITSQVAPQDSALINSMREEAGRRRSRLMDIVRTALHNTTHSLH